MVNNFPIAPHGGKLINRIAGDEEKKFWLSREKELPKVIIGPRETSNIEMIAIGGYSPLEGFMDSEDYRKVLEEMRLSSSLPWTIPITLPVSRDTAKPLKEGKDVALCKFNGETVAILHLKEKYSYNKKKEAELVYRTTDENHPGVAALYRQGEVLLGGEITLLNRPSHGKLSRYLLDPADTRRIFKERRWSRVVGFQTRNPIHRAHEYIQKCALEIMDALFLHPIVGETKSDDIPAEVRMRCYEVLLENYYPKERVILAINPSPMYYAGPREAVFHALVRKNYGCTHFIVGRDHAGVGNYYGSFDAHRIFDQFSSEEIGITPLFFDFTFFCNRCGGMASPKTCPHPEKDHLSLSGTKLRELLKEGKLPPSEFTRPEVARILINWWSGKFENSFSTKLFS